MSDKLTHDDAVKCYRVITGACSSGTRDFIENRLNGNRKIEYSIAEIIQLTKEEYGGVEFGKFFSQNQQW